jgi:hypothetical protein
VLGFFPDKKKWPELERNTVTVNKRPLTFYNDDDDDDDDNNNNNIFNCKWAVLPWQWL